MAIAYATQTELIGLAELEQRPIGGELGAQGDSSRLRPEPKAAVDSEIMRPEEICAGFAHSWASVENHRMCHFYWCRNKQ